jgi:hypothetical protein
VGLVGLHRRFLDILNVFLLLLSLFSGNRD